MIELNSAYGRYKKARDASWQALIDNKVDSLPVDVVRVANNNGITLLKNSKVNELRSSEAGISVFDGSEWFIVYDDIANLGRKRFTIAHEFGHIFLGHEMINGHHGRRMFDISKPQVETEADIFASRLLAPACVLWGLGIGSAKDIESVCGISTTAAKIRAERMRVLYARGKFLTSPLERQVFEQFRGFIEKTKK